MADIEPVAFLSYVRADDDHDAGRITALREYLEGEVKMQTGRSFSIFQDRNDLTWGQQWEQRIDKALLTVTFLIPIVTPRFFQSHACRKEFDTFMLREKTLGEARLILPIYYVACDEMRDTFDPTNEMASILRSRNWEDWRGFRFAELSSPNVREKIAGLASSIKDAMKQLEEVFEASKTVTPAPSLLPVSSLISVTPANIFDPVVPIARRERYNKNLFDQISKSPYYAYTTEFDEIMTPSEISEPDETLRLHSFLLARLRSVASDTEIPKRKNEIIAAAEGNKIAVSLLMDNSGSMRGSKILGSACWSLILCSILSQANIHSEVLGFTTRAWKGGLSRERWIADGKPPQPGRLNDLRYIVYKGFDETYQEAETNFGIMLREGILKENIDGEALLWACARLQKCPTRRKILFVLSDGAPVDDSTLSVNPGNFLERHLKSAVNWIKTETDVELYGIGLEHDVSRYYGSGSPTLNGLQVGPDLLTVISYAITNNWKLAGEVQRRTPKRETLVPMRKPRAAPARRKASRLLKKSVASATEA